MKIKSKRELAFVIQADRMMNRGKFKPSIFDFLKGIFMPDLIMSYLVAMRKTSYYKNSHSLWGKLHLLYYHHKFHRLAVKLGFSIGSDVFGYGLKIPHFGTIVVGGSNHIGNYAVLHTSTCISSNGKVIGDGLYLSTGAKITSKLVLGNNISIGANSLVNKSFEKDNIMIAGIPARYIKDAETWYIRDNFAGKVDKIEKLKKEYGL